MFLSFSIIDESKVIDPEATRQEWPAVRHLLRSHKKAAMTSNSGSSSSTSVQVTATNSPLEIFTSEITTIFKEEFPNISLVVAIAMTTPMASVVL